MTANISARVPDRAVGGDSVEVGLPARAQPDIGALALAATSGRHDTPAGAAGAPWGRVRRVAFRFAFVYLLLYNLPFPLTAVPGIDEPVSDGTLAAWDGLVRWVGSHVFRVTVTVLPGGSGDTTWNYVQLFCIAVLSALAAAAWSALDRHRKGYVQLFEWLRLYVRFVLAVTLIMYGTSKVVPAQFPVPPLSRMFERYGDSSPAGLLWTFIGASTGYQIFCGAAELLAGLLLTFRRTTLLGALVAVASLTNVVALNLCYDVPVKQYSAHLLAFALFVALPDLGRLANLFVLGRPVGSPAADARRPLFRRRGLDVAAAVLRTLIVLALCADLLYQTQTSRRRWSAAPMPALYGVWEVEAFGLDGKALEPTTNDATRWCRLIFGRGPVVTVQTMNQACEHYGAAIDETKQTLTLRKFRDPKWEAPLRYVRTQPDLLQITGTFDGRAVSATARRVEPPQFLLTHRGFHWINETPLIR